MRFRSTNPYTHLSYWIFVLVVLTLVFGLSWGNKMAAFYFVSMLLPIVLGTSYFFNYYLVPKFLLKRKYFEFGLYTLYMIIVSLYFETIVLMFTFVYLGHFSFYSVAPNASDSILLAVILYLLVMVGSLLLLVQQYREKQRMIHQLLAEQEKMKKATLEIRSNRKTVKIPYEDIRFVESLADYIVVHTAENQISSKERISHIAEILPKYFLRIHRSFIVNTHYINSFTAEEITMGEDYFPVGRSFRKKVMAAL
jgi:two-component system response regulator LytT